MRTILTLVLATAVISMSGCGDDSPAAPGPNPAGPNFTTFDVTWKPDVVYFDSTQVGALRRMDSATKTCYFDASNAKAASIRQNSILLIHGTALRRVTSTQKVGNEIEVHTTFAPLTDAVSEGRIAWDRMMNFRNVQTPSITLSDGSHAVLSKVAADTFNIEIGLGAYSVTVGMRIHETDAYVSCSVEKSVGTTGKVRYAFEGTIQQFRSKDSIVIAGGTLRRFDHKNTNLKGDLTLSLIAAGSGSDALKAELPMPFLTIPFLVGPIPFTATIRMQLVANAVVPLEGSSQVSARFKYDSEAGFTYNGASVEANAKAGTFSIEKNIAQTGAAGAIGVNWGIGFPRIELGMFGESLVPYVQTACLIGGDFTFTPPCQQARAQFIGSCGYNLKILGIDVLSGSKTLWQQEKVLLKAGQCK